MIAEVGHYALVLALALALIQSVVPLIGARVRDGALVAVAEPTALAQFGFVARHYGISFPADCFAAADRLPDHPGNGQSRGSERGNNGRVGSDTA